MSMVAVALAAAATLVAGATAGHQGTSGAQAYKPAGGWGKDGTGNGQFSSNAAGIATDNAGNVYVADSDNSRVQVFSAKGGFIRKFGARGSGNGQFADASDADVASDGSVWVGDGGNGRVQLFSAGGAFVTSVALSSEIPRAVAVDAEGNLLVSAEGGRLAGIRVFKKTASGWQTDGVLIGSSAFRPGDVEASSDGSFYFQTESTGGTNPRILRFSAEGKAIGSIKAYYAGRGFGVDPDCNIWVSNRSEIVKYSPSGKLLAKVSADMDARDIAVGPKGDVYVKAQSAGVLKFAEDKSKPATASIPGKLTAAGGVVKIAYTLSGVACPAVVGATATLTGAGISGKAAGLKLKAGAKNTITMKLSKAASGKATFKIVLKTNRRPTTETRSVTVNVR
jgi:sugar lactone lactonase YvrE